MTGFLAGKNGIYSPNRQRLPLGAAVFGLVGLATGVFGAEGFSTAAGTAALTGLAFLGGAPAGLVVLLGFFIPAVVVVFGAEGLAEGLVAGIISGNERVNYVYQV